MFLAADDTSSFSALILMLISVGIMVLAICWVVFPFIVIVKFNTLIREVKALRMGNKENVQRPIVAPEITPRHSEAATRPKAEPEIYKL